MATTPVSPKVPAATAGGAAATVLAFLLGNVVPVVHTWPDYVQGALLILIMAAGSAIAGYLKRDPLRGAGQAPAPKHLA